MYMYLVKGIFYSRDTLSCLLGVLTSLLISYLNLPKLTAFCTLGGRLRVYTKDMPSHTLIGWFHYKLNLEVMDAISKKDHVDSPFH
ncbi:hypothetical protein T08_16080 [Trichinella sp. T8]|nr:hypothetical protein T08_16080 [Trichinella sp. T8]